jgi:hypothetical protein
VPDPERHEDGVFFEDGIWNAYYEGALVACGPDKAIIQAAYDHRASADEYRSGPSDA